MRNSWFVISVVIFLIFGCGQTEVLRKDTVVLGHAGAGFPSYNNHYPINTEESIVQALSMQQADGVEVDVQLSADSTIVLYHDKRLESGCNDTGYVSNNSWSTLSKLKRRGSNSAIYKASKLWRLEDLMDYINNDNLDVWLSLNIQNQYEVTNQTTYNEIWFYALEKQLSAYRGNTKVIIETSDMELLKNLSSLKDQLPIKLFLTQKIDEVKIDELQGIISGVVTHYLDESVQSIDLAKSKNLEVALYGLKIRQDIPRALNLNPNYVQTDNIPLTFEYLK